MAQGLKTKIKIILTKDEEKELKSWQRSTTMPYELVKHGKIILLLASGCSFLETARKVNINDKRVYKWAYRFLNNRIDGLADKPRTGCNPIFSPGNSSTCRQISV